jgi:hypothetical protein
MKKILIISLFLLVLVPMAFAQNPASNKAFFAKGGGIDFAVFNQSCTGSAFDPPTAGTICSPWMTVFDLNDVIKTSSVGAIQAGLSMECALWTYNTVTAVSNQGKSTSSSRAGIEVQVLIDGQLAEPGKVVYCDRAQATGLQVTTVCECTVPDTTCTCEVTDTITLELFQRTKNANSFNYYLGPLAPKLHDVKVQARGIVVCFANGAPIACPNATLDAYSAKSAAAIGKATIVLEEQNNWGSN